MGGLVALETARILQKSQKDVRLILIDTQLLSEKTLLTDSVSSRVKLFLFDFLRSQGQVESSLGWILHEEANSVEEAFELLRGKKVLSSEMALPQLQNLFSVYTHNIEAMINYKV